MPVFGQIQEPYENPLAEKYRSDTIRLDSLSRDVERITRRIGYVMSPDSIDAPVEYGSIDSNYLDNTTRKVHLFGDAYARYKDLEIEAAYIVVDFDSNIVTATWLPDSLGNRIGLPKFTMGDKSYVAQKMRYNFKSRKGISYHTLAEEADMYIHSEKSKIVGRNTDTDQQVDILYGKDALITTCDHEHPHFSIRATRVKTIPDKLAVIGPSNLEIFGIPTPLWLPFGFYPVSETRTAGLIFPRDYEQSPQWGFGLRELGYYFPIKDWADVKITGDVYFNGSWGIGVSTNYVQRYKYRGSVSLQYSSRISERQGDYKKLDDRSFSIHIIHNQDAKANPFQNIGGSIRIQTNNFESLNYNDAQSVLTNTYTSNFNYSRQFPGKPYSFTAGMNHSQNTESHVVTINAPELNFRLNRIHPLKRKKRTGPEQWYEKIAFQYAGSARSQIISTDTTLFDQATWDNAQWGAQHKANASANFNVLKYFNVTPAIDYGETWLFKTRDRVFRFDPDDPAFVRPDTIYYPDSSGFVVVPDTVSFGRIDPHLQSGFDAFRSMSMSVNMNTQIFGLVQFKKGWLRGVRHVAKPSVGFSYTPQSPNRYYQEVPVSILKPDSTVLFSRFDNLLYSLRPNNQRQANLTWSVTNIFEAKYFSKRDSTDKKLKLFDNINVSGSYNLAADSLKFSPVNINGNTRLFKGITTITVGASYSFYDLDERGRTINKFYLRSKGHLLRFDNLRLRLSTRLSYNDVKGWFSGKSGKEQSSTSSSADSKAGEMFGDLFSNFSISHELGVVRMGLPGRDTTIITTNSVNLVGSMRITSNWMLNFGNIGYDFRAKQITYPDIGISRDLHCWLLSFNWQPTRGTYGFSLGVKPGTFDFLKFPYRRGNQELIGLF